MPPISKRYALFAVISLLLIISLAKIRRLQYPTAANVSSDDAENKNSKHDHIDWLKVTTQFPVSSYQPIPKPSSKKLPQVQHDFSPEHPEDQSVRLERRSAVKDVLVRSWAAYKDKAWLRDELAPISGKARDTFGGWAATLVDSLDTLWIADMKHEFEEAVNAVVSIDFSTTSSEEINVFETTIRYLGGLLAAYDLSNDRRLLDKSLELAEMLYFAFDNPYRMLNVRWKLHITASGVKQHVADRALVAEVGSLTLEFTRLAQITNDPKWYDAVARIMDLFDEQQDKSKLPGMWPMTVSPMTRDFRTGTIFTLGAMADSLYEYLPKMYALLGGSEMYERMYKKSASTAIEHSLFRPLVPEESDILLAGIVHIDKSGLERLEPQAQHLACFAGGMFALGGRLLQNQSQVDIGRKLTEGCIWAYDAGELGIMPEKFIAVPCEPNSACTWNQEIWYQAVRNLYTRASNAVVEDIIEKKRLKPGFASIDDRRYILRPEAIESVFILYRITGDKRLQDAAWRMFTNIIRHTETPLAYAAIHDVTDSTAPKIDNMESFWTAETLKYFYLIFSEPELISLDEYVFNTEAHPFKRPASSP